MANLVPNPYIGHPEERARGFSASRKAVFGYDRIAGDEIDIARFRSTGRQSDRAVRDE